MKPLDSKRDRFGGPVLVVLVAVLLIGLPLSVWFDLRALSQRNLEVQARDLNTVISGIRGFYSSDVVGRVLANRGAGTVVSSDYQTIPGAIPIPATFSLELGRVVGENQANIGYRFVSDFPFRHRAAHALDSFERSALASFRAHSAQRELIDVSWSGSENRLRLAAPIAMQQTCVACHNAHPDSPKRDWKVGDVRGIQELSIVQPIAANVYSFKYLLLYFFFAAALGIGFIALQWRQANVIRAINARLERANDFLADISTKISRYLSPQIYKRIFSGEKDVVVQTERKKLSIFFSDIKDFTATTERLQPEELTTLLNEYFSEMSAIALRWGGTVDKFVGDAIIVFFGDPESRGVAEDAKAALRMAVEMQRRLRELSVIWYSRGVEEPFRVRMGINTGFCNVGNFGSAQRMDYTIIGAEMNLAARLEASAEPGSIVVSYETFTLVRDIVGGHPLTPITMKGIGRQVVPYLIDALLEETSADAKHVISEHANGLDLYVDLDRVSSVEAQRLRAVLQNVMAALDGTFATARRDVRTDPTAQPKRSP